MESLSRPGHTSPLLEPQHPHLSTVDAVDMDAHALPYPRTLGLRSHHGVWGLGAPDQLEALHCENPSHNNTTAFLLHTLASIVVTLRRCCVASQQPEAEAAHGLAVSMKADRKESCRERNPAPPFSKTVLF